MKGKEEYRELRILVEELQHSGHVTADEHGRISYRKEGAVVSGKQKKMTGKVVGPLSMTKRGFGFVRPEGSEEEIFIAPKFMKTALHGDIVAVVLFARPVTQRRNAREQNVEGEVVEIVKRNLTTVIGRLEESRNFFFVVPDDKRISRDIYVAKDDAGQAKHGDKVVVQLLPWENEQLNPEGKIVEVLGLSGDARVEVTSVGRAFGLPMRFPEEVDRAAGQFSDGVLPEELRGRTDLRKTICFTIDPEDAKDFDDAISFEQSEDGNVRLGVHIADVSHYVQVGSVLDGEAFLRGTSVYMVNEVIPMLPERLSNNLCSLRPDVDRLTYSVWMNINSDGKVADYTIGKSVIRSARRFTYEEVQAIIENKKGEFADVILPLFKLTQVLLKRRRRNGSIDFETGEAKFKFDEQGLPSRIIKKVRLDAHRLVEECMLLANKTVAKHIGLAKKDMDVMPFIYRIHDAPDPSRLEDLGNFVKQFGYSLDTKSGVSSVALQKLLDKVKGSEVEIVINDVALRSMAKAIYSEKNIGHYGLGFKYYTHFTSPIRRYPDLVVHRLLNEYGQRFSSQRRSELEKSLPEICRHSSERERVATEAERASVKVMQVEYMKRHLGDQFEGVIAGVTNFGMFIEINDLLVEGLIRVRDLADDYYLFDEKHYSLRGRSRGKVYRLGDTVHVRVVSVNTNEREIDFAVIE